MNTGPCDHLKPVYVQNKIQNLFKRLNRIMNDATNYPSCIKIVCILRIRKFGESNLLNQV